LLAALFALFWCAIGGVRRNKVQIWRLPLGCLGQGLALYFFQ
jgi:hypothetical protein